MRNFIIIFLASLLVYACKPCKEVITNSVQDSIVYCEKIVYQQLQADSGLLQSLVECQNSIATMPDTSYWIGKYRVTSKVDSGKFISTWKRGIDSSLYWQVYYKTYRELSQIKTIVVEKKIYPTRWLYIYTPISMLVILSLFYLLIKKIFF